MNRRNFILGTGALSCWLGTGSALAQLVNVKRKPNIVVIFIDDMGYGDIEPFGSKTNKTPRLNRMAAEGIRLTSFYVAAPCCTPSRAALMTGCYPKRVGLATDSQGRVVLFPKAHYGLNPGEKTIASVLKDAGYATGCFGKWHLGDQRVFLPTNHGFDTYFGIPFSNDMWKKLGPPIPVLSNTTVVDRVEDMDDQAQLCKRFTDAATAFIRKNRDRPFFVYLPHAFIHYPCRARKKFMDQADGNALKAVIEEVDWSVGQVLNTIRELGLARDTVVFFTSDNGGTRGSSNEPLRGGKGSPYEGGMREPAIAWWPETIPAGSVCDELCTAMDLLPTFAALGGGVVPRDRVIDGKDISDLLLARKNAATPHKAFFYYVRDTLKAVRAGKWKLFTSGELYDLENDIGEQENIAVKYPDIVKRLNTYLDECRADLDNPKNCRPVGKVDNPCFLE
jgi:arylsulfatase A-like enzyme